MTEIFHPELPYEELPVRDNLALRQLRPDEADVLFELVDNNREHLGRWLPWVDSNQSPQDSRDFINLMVSRRLEGSEFGYGIYTDNELVGHTSLMHINDEQDPEIGYWIASSSAGKGITSETTKALTYFGLTTLGLTKIVIKAEPDNIASNKVAEKNGYQLERHETSRQIGKTMNVWSKIS